MSVLQALATGSLLPPGAHHMLIFEGFGDHSELIEREKIDKQGLEAQSEMILNLENVKFINIRNAGQMKNPSYIYC